MSPYMSNATKYKVRECSSILDKTSNLSKSHISLQSHKDDKAEMSNPKNQDSMGKTLLWVLTS